MNKFQNDKRKALNREHARLRYIYQKTLNLYSVIPRVKSPRRMLKIANQIFTLTIQARHQFVIIEAIRQQPIPRFASGGVVPQISFENINLSNDPKRKPQSVAIIGSGIHTGIGLRFGIDHAKPGHDKSAFILHSKDGVHVAESIAEMLRNNRFKSE